MRIINFLVFLVFVASNDCVGQVFVTHRLAENVPYIDTSYSESDPSWVKMLYSENPNMNTLSDAYQEWRSANPDVRNAHTRNYKHYMAHLISLEAIQSDGSLDIPTQRELDQRARQVEQARRRSSNQRQITATWETIGPDFMRFEGGVDRNEQANVYAFDQSISNPDILYLGTEGGCVFKTVNKGNTWVSKCESNFFAAINAIAIDPIDPDIVYISASNNIYKTTDGGDTWSNTNAGISSVPTTIRVDEMNANVVLAGGEFGLLRSNDAGATWSNVLTDRVWDIKFKTDDSNVVFALQSDPSLNQCVIVKSLDNGVTWTPKTVGWDIEASTGNKGGRMTVSDGAPGIIYVFHGANWAGAASSGEAIKICKSSDAGESWTTVYNYDTPALQDINAGQGYYDWDIEMSDVDSNLVIVGTQGRWMTNDGFATTNWFKVGGALGHEDLQEAVFNGTDYWVSNDGGLILLSPDISSFEAKMKGVNATEFWSFDQGWNRDAQVGSFYHNGTAARADTYAAGEFKSYDGAEPKFSALKHPYPDRIWSKGYGEVNGRELPDDIGAVPYSFNYNIVPNSEILDYTWKESETVPMPYAYNTHFTGKDNILYRSDDFGVNWNPAFTAPSGLITGIEIPLENTDIIYVGNFKAGNRRLYKSINGGVSFSQLTIPGSMSDASSIFLTAKPDDADVLFIAGANGGNSMGKIFRSMDGGMTFTDLTTSALNGEAIRDILAIAGTNNGIYAVTNHRVFYRSDDTADWVDCTGNLPVKLGVRGIKPFYKEGKIRIATIKRGVYGTDMYEQPTLTMAKASANLVDGMCNKDTFQFDDYSPINHTGAAWSWSFDPAPAYVSDLNIRNPKVVFGTDGVFKAYMTVTQGGQTFIDTLDKDIIITTTCVPDPFVGNATRITNDGTRSIIKNIDYSIDEFTIGMWIRPDPNQVATATFVSTWPSFMAINKGNGNEVRIHYQGAGGAAWGQPTNLYYNEDEWTHVAMTSSVAENKVTLYVDGVPFNYNFNAVPFTIKGFDIGWYHNWWGARFFKGNTDEFFFFDRALTQDEIRLNMNLVQTQDPNLQWYLQFNETSGASTQNKNGTGTAEVRGTFVPSTAPVGPGTSSKQDIVSAGIASFPNEGLEMEFGSGTLPNGEVVVTRIENEPDTNPSENEPGENYWVIRNYGTNQTISDLVSATFEGYGTITLADASAPNDLRLFTRKQGQDLQTWVELNGASSAVEDPINTITFTPPMLDKFGQFGIAKGDCDALSTVGNTNDSGVNSLRKLVADYCAGDTITFDPTLAGDTIKLTSGQISINKSLVIQGLGSGMSFIDAQDLSRIFSISPGVVVCLEGFTLLNAEEATDGGAILNNSVLYLKDVILKSNSENGVSKAFTNYGTTYIKPSEVRVEE